MSVYKTYILSCFVAACLLLSPLSAYAALPQISGSANLGYSAYEQSQSGSKLNDGESFYQDYSLIAMKRGNLYNRRGGPYNLTLTYDHLQYATDINGDDHSPYSSFLGWDGKLKLNMPHINGLDLILYSSNRATAAPVEESSLGTLAEKFIIDVSVHEEKSSGFSLSLGINGGPYYHLYQSSHETVGYGSADQKFSRRGAGVQYGVNWLHFYQDKEPDGFERRTFILGNIGLPAESNYLSSSSSGNDAERLWYRLINWLDISVDFMYSEEESDVTEDLSTKRMTMAFDGDLGRTSILSYSLYERADSDSQSTRLLRLPLWTESTLSPGTTLTFKNNYDESQTKDLATLAVSKSRAIAESLTLTSRDRRFFLETGYDYKKSAALGMETESHSIYFDGATRRSNQFNYGLLYRYDTSKSTGAANEGGASYSHLLNGSVTYSLTRQTRFMLSQGYLTGYQRDNLLSERYERFTTSFNINHGSSRSFSSSLELTRTNLLNEDGTEELQNMIDADFEKTINRRLQMTIYLNYTDNQDDLDGIDKESSSSTSSTRLVYKLERNLESLTSLATSQTDTSEGSSTSKFEVGEELKYTYNRKGFRRRELFDVAGSVWYKQSETAGGRYDENWLEMGINYYPTRAFSCGAAYSSENDSKIITKNLYLALSYTLLTLKGSYSQRLNEAGDMKEDLYNIDFTKRF